AWLRHRVACARFSPMGPASQPRSLTRRTFVAWAVGVFPLVGVARRVDLLAASWLGEDEATMRSLAAAILPADLGVEGASRVAREFQHWIDDYRENAELVPGYGASALEFTRPSPRARWAAQVESLRRSGFDARPAEERRAVIAAALAGEKLDRMPDVGD